MQLYAFLLESSPACYAPFGMTSKATRLERFSGQYQIRLGRSVFPIFLRPCFANPHPSTVQILVGEYSCTFSLYQAGAARIFVTKGPNVLPPWYYKSSSNASRRATHYLFRLHIRDQEATTLFRAERLFQ